MLVVEIDWCGVLLDQFANFKVETVLDKESFTLEELLDEEEIIQECKALNTRLINFLRDRDQVEQLLRYIVEEAPEDAESKRAFKFPFIACEVFTCEIDVILKTLVDEEKLMNLLFSFLEPNRPHSAPLAGYFSKVVVCLMMRKTVPLMNYVQAHQDVFRQLVDLIGITSIMEVLVRLVGADDHVYPNFIDVMQWVWCMEGGCNPLNLPVALKYDKALGYDEGSYHRIQSGCPGDLLMLLNVSSDEKTLPTTYGELRPPLGKHRLKIVEFIAVLLRSGNEEAEKELVSSGTIQRVIDLFFEYPYNSSLHHHVDSIISSCLESKSDAIVDHLFRECDLIGKFLQTDKHPILSGDANKPTVPAAGKSAPRAGNIGHITRISNKLIQLGNSQSRVQACLQENSEWNEWQTTVLQGRNAVENVYRWACGRPTALQDRTRDSDEDDMNDRNFDVAALANNLSQAFRYKIYENEDAGEVQGAHDRDDEDVYFDDESAEVVISSLRLGDDQGSSLFTNSNWFAFQDDRIGDEPVGTSMSEMEEVNLNGTANGGNSSSDDEVVVGDDDELAGSKDSINGTSSSNTNLMNGFSNSGNMNPDGEKTSASNELGGFFRFETSDNDDMYGDRPLPEWVGWSEASDLQFGGASVNPFEDHDDSVVNPSTAEVVASDVGASLHSSGESTLSNGPPPSSTASTAGSAGSDVSQRSAAVPSLFEEDVEFVGVELEGTEKAMEQALKEGIVGEAGPLKKNIMPKVLEKENPADGEAANKEFNDANYWRVDQEVAVLE
ncbi:hypothetical protein C1H46_009665 [Malus baccata]|uniref:Uncharacterized protein n=1 Tax=Malus baccata TaxID=106549 RepID=A0A540N0W0_MALBA|nr:hypothetical protein C1H46_009665 [Malus baccata]